MASRTRKETLRYRKYLASLPSAGCDFCSITPKSKQFVQETTYFFIIKNIFPYSFWDLQRVSDHLLILPKKHTDTLSDLTRDEAVEYVELLGSYESVGYNVYSRAPQTKSKSVAHQHTHLIKSEGRLRKVVLYTQKPYLRVSA